MSDAASRIAAARVAYHEGCLPKLLSGNSEAAIACLRRAEAIAVDGPPLGDSLLALIRYRLGHAHLRQATGSAGGDAAAVGGIVVSADLAVACFEQATHSDIVAPWAFPYLLAALNARSKLPKPASDLDARTGAAWAAACARAKRGTVSANSQGDPIPLQRPSFNMLELATFFLGYSVDELLTGDNGFSMNRGEQRAILVGPGLVGRHDRMPWSVAEELVQNLGRDTGAVVFTLPADNARPRIHVGASAPQSLGPEIARVLALVLLGEATADSLEAAVAPPDEEDIEGLARNRQRQYLHRARLTLRELTHRDDAIVADRGGDQPGRLRVADGLRIYGVIDLDRLDAGGGVPRRARR